MDLGKTLAESRTYSRLRFQESVAFPMLTTLDLVDPLAKGDGTLTASEVKDALDQVGWVRCNGQSRCWFAGYGVADENNSEEADKYWPRIQKKLLPKLCFFLKGVLLLHIAQSLPTGLRVHFRCQFWIANA